MRVPKRLLSLDGLNRRKRSNNHASWGMSPTRMLSSEDPVCELIVGEDVRSHAAQSDEVLLWVGSLVESQLSLSHAF